MAWRKYLLIPQLIWRSLGAPRDQGRAWERYWSGVRGTGVAGDVFWDADQPVEVEFAVAQLRAHADVSLPIVDLGCGNGRMARAFAGLGLRVLGIDASTAAVRLAQQEAAASTTDRHGRDLEFRVADAAQPGFGQQVAAELGDANVYLRGVLHLLESANRVAVVANLATIAGTRGRVFICETDVVAGDQLEFLVRQGATPTSLPEPLRRLVAAGLPAPSHFGAAEVAEFFPAPGWQVLASGPTVMYGVPLRPGGPLHQWPSYFAILRTCSS